MFTRLLYSMIFIQNNIMHVTRSAHARTQNVSAFLNFILLHLLKEWSTEISVLEAKKV